MAFCASGKCRVRLPQRKQRQGESFMSSSYLRIDTEGRHFVTYRSKRISLNFSKSAICISQCIAWI